MSRPFPFQRGLVVGKFAPLHRGHEMVIRRALEECNEVIVMTYGGPEFPGCELEKRRGWLSALFPTVRVVTPTETELASCSAAAAAGGFFRVPDNDADAGTHRRFCAFWCWEVLGVTVDAVFTSEDYGTGFAVELERYFGERRRRGVVEVKHVLVDRERRLNPISGSRLRADVHAHREWLSPLVYVSFVERVCVLGGESSGKSVLTAELARVWETVAVAEYGRERWEERKGRLQFEDMLAIGRRQVAWEDEAAGRANRYLFCDTSPLTTLFYSRDLFGTVDPELEQLAGRTYRATILCAPDFLFVQDGTRRDAAFRQRQHEWYLHELTRRRVPFLIVEGSVETRVSQVREYLAGQ